MFFLSFFRKKTALRRYSNLIRAMSGRWPNWNASKPIHAGDFGTFDKETGCFVVEGNIYTFGKGSADLAKWRPISCGGYGILEVTSGDVRVQDPNHTSHRDGAHLQDVPFDRSWKFGTRDGAILYLHQLQGTYVPPEVFSTGLLDRRLLKNKWVVSAAHTCPAYFMYFSDGSGKEVTAKLYRNATKQAEESADSGHDSPTFNWVVEGGTESSISQYGCQPGETYVPLFDVELIK